MSYEDLKQMGKKIQGNEPESEPQELDESAERKYKRRYEVSRRLQGLRELRGPIARRGRAIGRRGYSEAERSLSKTEKTLSRIGLGREVTQRRSKEKVRRGGIIQNVIMGVRSVRGAVSGTERTGLSEIVTEISSGHVEQFHRSMLSDGNPGDRQFFSETGSVPMKERILINSNVRDMNNLTTDPIKRTQEVKYV
jgi:hypothetical protein